METGRGSSLTGRREARPKMRVLAAPSGRGGGASM